MNIYEQQLSNQPNLIRILNFRRDIIASFFFRRATTKQGNFQNFHAENKSYHAILLSDGVVVVEGIVDHAVLVIEWLPVPDR